MKVLFVHRDAELASARVRVLGLVPYLEALGLRCETAVFPRSPWRLRGLLANSDADVVVLQKKLPTLLEGIAWRAGRAPRVFDFDDAIPLRQSPRRNGSWESPTRRRRFARALACADAFSCGNDYLASFCHARARPVAVLPSPVPLDVPRAGDRAERGADVPRIGWIGAPHNLGELRALEPALASLAREHAFTLAVISERPFESPLLEETPGVSLVHVPWSLATQEEEIARLDVGVMPLGDSPWNRGKCAYKLLQYMAAAVPAVASPVGMNRQVVDHGRNGLLADGPDAWRRAIGELLRDAAHARVLGLAGRRTVEERFGYPTVAASWKRFLGRVVSR